VIALVVSFAVTLASVPLIRRLMLHTRLLDVPNHRSSHTFATPRGGGIACLLGVLSAAVIVAALGRQVPCVALMAAAGLGIIGFADDHRSLPAVPRLLAQSLAGMAVGTAVGGFWWAGVGAVVLPMVVNMINFMDGINGITGLHVGLWGLTAFWVGSQHGVSSLIVLGAVAAGSSLGFLPWNAPRAKIFLGDVGSYLMGGLVGAGILYGGAHGTSTALVLAPMTLYFVDTVATLLRRVRRGAPVLEAHREHIYQQLTSDAGYPHVAVSVGVVVLAAMITGAWLLHPAVGAVATVFISVLYLCAMRIVPSHHLERAQ